MSEAQVLGLLLIVFVLLLLLAMLARSIGWRETIKDLLIAVGFTLALFLGMGLLTGRIA
jgi:cellulose synthase/poly-beta-1,6-N-acetylglucosamine synthase-like glycosyltransferase